MATLVAFLNFTARASLVGSLVGEHLRLGWVETLGGVVNVVTALDGKQQRVTEHTEDVGLLVSGLTLANGALYWVEAPMSGVNPPSVSAPSMHKLRRWAGATQTLLELDGDPVFAVNANGTIAYATDNVVRFWPHGEPLWTRSGRIRDIAWHPHEPTVAFSLQRREHCFVGIWREARVRWAASSVDCDHSPVWSPTGDRLAFFRDLDSTDEFGREDRGRFNALPRFAVLVADVVDAVPVRTRWVHSDWSLGRPDGDAGYGSRPLLWAESEVLFGAEDDWIGIFAARVDGDVAAGTNKTRRITTGACEVPAYALGPEGVLYTVDNCDDLDSNRLVSRQLASGSAAVISHGLVGIAEYGLGMVALGGGRVAYLRFSNQEAGAVCVHGAAGEQCWTEDPPRPGTEPELLKFPSADGVFSLSAQLFHPVGTPRGGILFTHGGSQRQMFKDLHYSQAYALLHAENQFLASQGFAVLSVNYRSGSGYGREFRACPGCGWYGGREYVDVKTAGTWLSRFGPVGIKGLSYGGLNALQAAVRDPQLFRCAAANAPVFNWLTNRRNDVMNNLDVAAPRPAEFRQLPLGPEPGLASPHWAEIVREAQQLSWESSPAGHVQQSVAPLLLIHGDLDEEVDFQETVGVVRALRRLGATPETLIFPDENHGLALFAHQLEAAQAQADFFSRHLAADLVVYS